MADHDADMEAKQKKFTDRVKQGWAILHPATEADREIVRQAVQEQWAKEQQAAQEAKIERDAVEEKTRQQELKRAQEQEAKQEKQSNDHGQDQGLSH